MLQIQCKMSRDAASVSNPSPYSIYDEIVCRNRPAINLASWATPIYTLWLAIDQGRIQEF